MNPAWFDKDGRRENISQVVRTLREALSAVRTRAANYRRAYYSEPVLDVNVASDNLSSFPTNRFAALRGRLQANLFQSAIDTAQAQLVRIPGITVLTNGGDWKKHVSAKKLGLFISGVFRASGLNDAAGQIFIDGMTTPVGAPKFSMRVDGGIACERVNPRCLVWNPSAGQKPRELYWSDGIPRGRLMAEYPEHRGEIERLPRWTSDHWYRMAPDRGGVSEAMADLVEVTEGWHLGERQKDGKVKGGRHVMVLGEKLTVVDEDWGFDFFPIPAWRWRDSDDHWGGEPAADSIFGLHLAYNRMARACDEHITRGMVLRFLLPKASELTKDFTDLQGEKLYFNSAAMMPQIVPGVVPPSGFFSHMDRVERLVYAQLGVNQVSSEGGKPPGVESGEAIRAYTNLAQSRMVEFGRRWEAFFTSCAHIVLAMADKAYGEDNAVRVRAPNTDVIQDIWWKDIDLREDEIELEAQPISQLPNTLTGRIETINELKNILGDAISPERYVKMLSIPDLDEFTTLESARTLVVEKLVENALEDGELVSPDPLLGEVGLNHLVDYGTKRYLDTMLRFKDTPEINLELCRRLISRARSMLEQPTVPPPGPPAAGALPPAPGLPGLALPPPVPMPPVPALPPPPM